MQTATIPSAARLAHWERKAPTGVEFPPLETVTRPTLTTGEAAFYLNRRPQTLRGWASAEDGPLRPIRVNGRLAWRSAEIRRLLGVA
jgi:hypothetical protein